ncbi:MAG TPA: glutathione S-transferase family protein [Acetobacteraceae bacterium]
MYVLHARPGWGSAIIELQLACYGLPFRVVDHGDMFKSAQARAELAPLNPLSQLPTLELPGGEIMTESAAITLHLADVTGSKALVPPPGDPHRPGFLRWLVFLVANIYPTFTYADDPARFVELEAARAPFRAKVDGYAQSLWRIANDRAGSPWFLGDRFSALDLYIGVMVHWRPRRAWFAAECLKLDHIAAAAQARPELRGVWQRNFPDLAEAT